MKNPHPTTIDRRQAKLEVEMPPIEGDEPLMPLMNGAGLKYAGDGEWMRKARGLKKRSDHLGFHMIVDAGTLTIHGFELTKSAMGNALVPPAPLDQVSSETDISASRPMAREIPSNAAR